MADPIEKILRELDQPVEPRPEFGTRLLDQLLDSLGSTTPVAPPARPRFPFLRELAAAAAVLVFIAGLAIAFSVLRSGRQPSTSPSPAPPRPSPALTQPLNVSPATALILFNDLGNPLQVDGMTWDGQSGKLIQVPDAGQNTMSAESSNPAGKLFVAFPNILDTSGHVVAKLAGGPYADPGVGMYFVGTWADDGFQYCQVVPIFGGTSPVTGILQLTTPGGTPRDVVRVGTQASGENTLTVSTCSVLADRAVVIQADPNPSPYGPAPLIQYWVVQLSTGHILWTHDLTGKGVANVVASRDGRYVAEDQTTGATTIYGANGSQVGHVNGWVQTFSWDGALAIVVANGGRATVVRWSDGKVVWTLPADDRLSGFQPEPGGTSLAVQTINGVLYVVSSNGRVVAQRRVASGALLACNPRACVRPPPNSDVMQVLPRVMVGNVGWADGLQRTTDGGLHWQYVPPPTPPNQTKGGNSTYILDVDHAWVTVATGDVALLNATNLVIFRTADGGQTWSQGKVPLSGVVNSSAALGFIDATHGWLVTDSGGQSLDKSNRSTVNQPLSRAIYATVDGGATWSRLVSAHEGDGSALGTLGLGCSMSGLTFTNSDLGWLTWDCNRGIASPRSQLEASLVATSRDGGRSWRAVDLPSFPTSTDYICGAQPPVFTSSQGVLPVNCGGIGHPGFTAVYATSDTGRSWTFRKLPFWSQQLDFVDASTGWAFSSAGVDLYRTTDAGSSWTVVKRFASEQKADGLMFFDSKTGFVLTSRYAPDRNSGYSTMWKTADGGKTWSVMSSKPNGGNRCC